MVKPLIEPDRSRLKSLRIAKNLYTAKMGFNFQRTQNFSESFKKFKIWMVWKCTQLQYLPITGNNKWKGIKIRTLLFYANIKWNSNINLPTNNPLMIIQIKIYIFTQT